MDIHCSIQPQFRFCPFWSFMYVAILISSFGFSGLLCFFSYGEFRIDLFSRCWYKSMLSIGCGFQRILSAVCSHLLLWRRVFGSGLGGLVYIFLVNCFLRSLEVPLFTIDWVLLDYRIFQFLGLFCPWMGSLILFGCCLLQSFHNPRSLCPWMGSLIPWSCFCCHLFIV